MADHTAAVDQAFVERQRKRLEALRAELLGAEERGMAQERLPVEEHGDEAEEFEDAAQRSVQGEIDQALLDSDAIRLRAIDRALQKIDEGTYGLSDMSGKAIPRARLEVNPEAVLTVQEEAERESPQHRP
jgi:DnaK suppressor protein